MERSVLYKETQAAGSTRRRTIRFFIGALILLVVLLSIAGFLLFRPQAATTITCLGGSEKAGLMNNPEVKKILAERYHLAVNFQSMGSLDQALLPTDQLKQRQANCIWPSSAGAQLVFEAKHNKSDFPAYKADTVLTSPEVIYAGPESTEALIKAGVVQQRENHYFIVKMKELLLDFVLKNKRWEDIAAPTLRGPIKLGSTDPTQSNSGFMLYLLKLSIVSTSDPFTSPTEEQARKALPTVRTLYETQGLQAVSSGFGFDQWLQRGGEVYLPLYAGYESQVIEKIVQNPQQAKGILKDVRVLYPEPTVYSDHPILALDKQGQLLIEAMKDVDIQRIAWKQHGFRPVQSGIASMGDFSQVALAEHPRATNVPNANIILKLQECLKNNVCQ
jgi:ABC-type Fe3+ transport system substrate-binding protein